MRLITAGKLVLLFAAVTAATVAAAQPAAEPVGKRPYEMDWANRTEDSYPPLVDFEDLADWQGGGNNVAVTFERSREQQLFGKYVGKLTYRATGDDPRIQFGPAQPIKINAPFDAVSCWVYGNNWSYAPNAATPSVHISAVFTDSAGAEIVVPLTTVVWEQWYLCTHRLTPEQIARVKNGASFVRFQVDNGRNKQDRVLFFDSLAVFAEKFPPLTFDPRPARGIAMFPGQGSGTNTGPGKLPFPNREQTILPDNLVKDFKTSVTQQGRDFVFTYKGSDGTLTYRLSPRTGTFGDITAQWQGRAAAFRPLVDGGIQLLVDDKPVAPEKLEPLGTKLQGDTVVSRWRASNGAVSAEVTYTYRLWNKSLVIDTVAPGGSVAEVRYGYAEGLSEPRLVQNPFYHYGYQFSDRPGVAVFGPSDKPLFLTGNTDWYLSNASVPFSVNDTKDGKVRYQGGVRYVNRTDGKRNDCFERFFVTVSPQYAEVLPTVPNPKSPHMQVAGTHVWRAHGAGNRENDAAYWTRVWRYGMRECLITDHETGWRDEGESFTFRTRPAPGKGGDKGQYDYARLMQDKLGFVYGPYNNYTDFAPVNEFWSFDLISRNPDNNLQGAWMRCYAPKPSRAVEYCAKLAPIIQQKFRFSTAYCDVHTAVAPWERVDYDARVPGAGTFAGTFYSYGEIMLHQKAAWGGPVYSEGNHHFYYSGLTDGNYAQDRGYDIPNMPWLVDLDLRKMHDLDCNFGMGAPSMFYGERVSPGSTPQEQDAYIDRFLAATVAFGHPGFLCFEGGYQNVLRSYYMIQQLAANYTLSSAADIRYVNAAGKALDTSAAIAGGDYKRSQVTTRYANGTVTYANGSRTERMRTPAGDLPPNGYAGWNRDKSVFVASTDSGPGTPRYDYAETPAYIYLDGRGHFTRQRLAAGSGLGICRLLGNGTYELIPYKGSDCGFKISVSKAVALSEDNKELGPAQLRTARGYTYVVPVEGAFSYLLSGGAPAVAGTPLTTTRDEVVAGEIVPVKGQQQHTVTIPAAAKAGDRTWQQLEGQWIDFNIVPLTSATVALSENRKLNLRLSSNLPQAAAATVSTAGQQQQVQLVPGKPCDLVFDLGAPTEERSELLAIEARAGDLAQKIERGLRTISEPAPVVTLPAQYQTGMCLRGQAETADFGTTSGFVAARDGISCGDVSKTGIFMHPPYVGGTGYSFALYDPVALPKDKPAALRAYVGKADGSYLADGILYKIELIDAAGKGTIVAEKTVTDHAWVPIEADLSRWAGQPVRLKLISDVGPADDSSGDWACWAEMRLESLQPVLQRRLEDGGEQYRREPAPLPLAGLTVADLRAAKSGLLHYDGCGFSGNGQYGCYGVLNGVNMGFMTPAGGNETAGEWSSVTMDLTPEAIAKLARRNVFAVSDPNQDWFKVRRFWLELTLADGRKVSSDIAAAAYTQPPGWPYAEGVLVPHGQDIQVELWFDAK